MIENDVLLKAIDQAPVYQPIPSELFVDERRIKYFKQRNKRASRQDVERNELIDLRGKTVFDIGCNIGYFGWNNAKDINQYIGIDSDPACIKVAKLIKEELGFMNLQFISVNLVHYTMRIHYETCLFFSVYHHLLYQVGAPLAKKILNRISEFCDELYFDMGQKDEYTNSARWKWHHLLPDEKPKIFIEREVLENTEFIHCEVIGETSVKNSKRLLFRFTK